jgi:hypothetical protein
MTHTDRVNEPQYNAGNFQEYNYECEWMECSWNIGYNCIHLVTAFTYPWINLNRQPLYTNQ